MYDNDFLIFVAAGNQAVDACSMCPANSDHVIAVGAVNKNGYYSTFSNYGPCVDIFAPGEDIISADSTDPKAYVSLTGTSMACPHVSASAAVAWSGLLSQPAAVIKCILINSSRKNAVKGLPSRSHNRFLNYNMLRQDEIVRQCIAQYGKAPPYAQTNTGA